VELVEIGIVYLHFQVMSDELNTPKLLICPQHARRNFATNFAGLKNGHISYFVGLDARTCPHGRSAVSSELDSGIRQYRQGTERTGFAR